MLVMLVLNIGTNVSVSSVSIRQAGRLKAPRQRYNDVPNVPKFRSLSCKLAVWSLERQFFKSTNQGNTRSYKVKKQVIQA